MMKMAKEYVEAESFSPVDSFLFPFFAPLKFCFLSIDPYSSCPSMSVIASITMYLSFLFPHSRDFNYSVLKGKDL